MRPKITLATVPSRHGPIPLVRIGAERTGGQPDQKARSAASRVGPRTHAGTCKVGNDRNDKRRQDSEEPSD